MVSKKYGFLIFISALCLMMIYLNYTETFNLAALFKYQMTLKAWVITHKISASFLYCLIFTLLIAFGVPCASFMTLLGGLLFGSIAIFYAELATGFGGLLLFLFIKHTFRTSFSAHSITWVKKMEAGFKKNAFTYLLTLRLVPIFPCWLSNISAGILNIPTKIFLTATLIGIFPATVIYGLAGISLNTIINEDQLAIQNIMLMPSVFFPLVGVTLLSIFPLIYKSIKSQSN